MWVDEVLQRLILAAVLAAAGGCVDLPVDADAAPPTGDAIVDRTAPETTITAGPPPLVNRAAARFELAASEPARFRCRLDAGDPRDCGSPWDVTGLTDGEHHVEVFAIDRAENADPTPASQAWRIDTMPPETRLVDAPPPLDNSASVSITFEAPGDAAARFLCSLDGAAFADCVAPFTAGQLTDGHHRFRVRAQDPAGNVDPSPAVVDWDVDTTSPDTVIDGGPAGIVASRTATFTFSAPDAGTGATFACRLDAAPFAPCLSPRVLLGLADGPHAFEVRVTDALGNTDPAPARRQWTIDATGPVTTLTARPSNPSTDRTPTFELTANEPATFECQIDGEVPYTPCVSPYTAPTIAAGLRAFRARATDTLGNRGPEVSYEWAIDDSAPAVTITSGPGGPVASTVATFTWNASEAATFCHRFTGDAADTCTTVLAGSGAVTRTGLAQGAQAFTITATDALGNAGAPVVRAFSVDTIGPAVAITAGPNGVVGTISSDVTFASSEAATFCYQVDASGERCTPPPGVPSATVGIAALDGAHRIDVVARDALGNRTAQPATRAWTVDTVRPTTAIAAGPAPGATLPSGDATVQLTASEPSTICWRIGGGAETCSAPAQVELTADLMGLADGVIAFSARASDAIGVGAAVPRSWTVDTVRPTVAITGGPAAGAIVPATSVGFTVIASEPSTICWRFGGGGPQCSAPGALIAHPAAVGLGEGAQTFTVSARDAIGDGLLVSRAWSVDSQRPAVTITAGPAAGSTVGSGDVAFTATSNQVATFCWRFDGGAESCSAGGVQSVTATAPALGEGGHVFEIHARDTVGPGAAVSRAFTVDSVRPAITITAGPAPNATLASQTATFTVAASEPAMICWSFDGGAASCTAPGETAATITGVALPAGAASFSVTGADAVGAGAATVRGWTIDLTRPTVAISAGPTEGERIDAVATAFTVQATEPSTICWRLDGGAPTCAAGVMVAGIDLVALAQGVHALAISASDAVGVGATLTRTFVVDTVRPTVTITAGPGQASATRSTSAAFTVAASEASTICWKFNGGAETCSAAGQVTATANGLGLPAGAAAFEVRAIDAFGTGPTTNRTWTIDTAMPTVVITAGPAQGSTSTSRFAQLAVAASEPSLICWRFNGGLPTCSPPAQLAVNVVGGPFADGPIVVTIEARDAVGAGPVVLRSWTIDAVP